MLIQNTHNPKIYARSIECVLIGYSASSKTYRVYHCPTHKVFESFHVVFIEAKDDVERVFRPGQIAGLGDDDNNLPPTPERTPTPPSIPLPTPAAPIPTPDYPIPVPDVPLTPPPITTQPVIPTPIPAPERRTSRVPVPSARRAEANSIQRISAVE